MPHTHDVLIIGRGLAGAILGEALLDRGLRIHVFDLKRSGNASMAAAGVVNPLVMRRDLPSWRALELLPLARAFYERLGERLGMRVWHPMELVKLFSDEQGATQWERAMQDPVTGQLIDRRPQPGLEHGPLDHHHGHGTVHAAGWLDLPMLLEAQRRDWSSRGLLTEADVALAEVRRGSHGVRIGACSAPLLVWCTGPFAALPGLVPVKGEGLSVVLPGLPLDRMVHRGVFALPMGGGVHKVGSTFRWDQVWDGPTAEARNWLLGKLTFLTPIEALVVDHWAGVRPASKDRRPILGRIGPHEACMNGLGARGVLLAPWCATHLAAHLLDGGSLDPEVDVARFS